MADPTPADRQRPQPVPFARVGERERIGAPLPDPLTSFVGRERDLAAVGALLRAGNVRLLTMIGSGGVGKTRLALRVAAEARAEFTDGVGYVPLAAVADPELVVPTVAQALGVRETGERGVADQLVDVLGDRRVLLVLDNFEQVIDAGPVLVDLLVACPRLKVLVTSRAPLRLSGERVYAVAPMSLPDPGDTSERLGEAEAVCLFVERAQAVDPAFVLTDDNARATAAVCARLEGLPLAIELAAAKTSFLSPEGLLARLARRLPLLTGGPRDAPARLRTMRDAIAWSHDLLTAEEQTLFRRLAVFSSGFTLEAAEAVAGGDGDLGCDVWSGIEALAEQSVLRQRPGDAGEPRFGMLETIREYALERLAASGEQEAVRARHAAWCLALAEAAEPHLEGFGRGQARWLARLDDELGNLRAALVWFNETGDARAILRLVAVLDVYWFTRPYGGEARRWLETGLAAGAAVPADVRGMALHVLTHLACHLGDHEVAVARAEEDLALARTTDTPFALGRAHYGLGMACEYAGATDRAVAHYAQAIPLLRQAGARSWVYLALADLGGLRQLGGDVAGAVPLLDEALALVRQDDPADPLGLQDTLNLAHVLGRRAHAARAQGDPGLALRLFGESIAAARQIGAERIVLGAVAGLAGVALDLGQPARAARLLGAVATAREAHGLVRIAHALHADLIEADACARLGEQAFAEAFAGGRALPYAAAVAEALAIDAPTNAKGSKTARAPFGLTPREREVLRRLVEGKTDRQIAEALFVSRRTVTTHTSSLFAKLGVSSRTEAAALAVREGLV